MDLKTAFPSSIPEAIVKDTLNRLRPLSIFLAKHELTGFVINALDHIAHHRSGHFDVHASHYIHDTKSLFEILLNFRNENDGFLLPTQLHSLYKIILLKPCLEDFALNADGTASENAFKTRTPLSTFFEPHEIMSFLDCRDIISEQISFHHNDISTETRALYYVSLLREGQEFIERFRHASAISNETLLTLDCLSRTLDGLHDTIPYTSTEMTIQNFVRYFQELPKVDPHKVTFMADWRAKPPAA